MCSRWLTQGYKCLLVWRTPEQSIKSLLKPFMRGSSTQISTSKDLSFLALPVHFCQLGDSLTMISAGLDKLLWVMLCFWLKFVTTQFNTLLHTWEWCASPFSGVLFFPFLSCEFGLEPAFFYYYFRSSLLSLITGLHQKRALLLVGLSEAALVITE